MFTREHIVAEIKRTAAENGGVPLGVRRFEGETGIRASDWMGKFWVRWGDALTEAGFQPNSLQGPRTDDELLESLALLARALGHFPVANELKMKARSEPGFPWHNTFSRFGNKKALASRLREFALARGHADVVHLCQEVIDRDSEVEPAEANAPAAEPELGYVYLLRSGRFYKIGRSNAVGRRERELAIQLPEKAEVVHSLKTDDPPGIENYWHQRFADRRKNGEWFELTAADVSAFRRRKFM